MIAVIRVLQFAADHHRLPLHIARTFQVKRNVCKRRLKTNARRHVHIKHEFLQRLLHLVVRQLVVFDEWRKQRIKVTKCLRTRRLALQRIEKVDNLPENRAKVFRRFARNLVLHTCESAAQQILQIPAHTVHAQQIQIVNMHIARAVQPADFRCINLIKPICFTNFARDIVI